MRLTTALALLPSLLALPACVLNGPPPDKADLDSGDTGADHDTAGNNDTATDDSDSRPDSPADDSGDTNTDDTNTDDTADDSDTGTVVEPEWSYEGATGPEHWGELSEEWELCATGTAQSPIDLDPETFTTSFEDYVEVNWNTTGTHAYNSGHYIRYNVDAGSQITTRDGTFNMLQFHFHGYSEHTVNGERFPMEMHIVHQHETNPDQLLVVAFFIDAEREGTSIDLLELGGDLHFMDAVALPESETTTDLGGTVDLSGLGGLLYQGYVSYDGSLTTPDCSEGVRFYVSNVSL